MIGTLVVSPHLDDAVLSCGQLLAARPGAAVLTVFAGLPRGRKLLTPYDEGCGFVTSQEAVLARRSEDSAACGALGAQVRHIDQLDGQYRPDERPFEASRRFLNRLRPYLQQAEEVYAPLGLRHPDHLVVTDLALALAPLQLWLYEELPYRVLHPEAVPARLGQLAAAGVGLSLDKVEAGDATVKAQAVRCYRSQIDRGDLDNEHCWLVPERYWRVAP